MTTSPVLSFLLSNTSFGLTHKDSLTEPQRLSLIELPPPHFHSYYMQSEPSEDTQKTLRTQLAVDTHDSRRHGFITQNDSAQGRFAHETCLGGSSRSTVAAYPSAHLAAASGEIMDDTSVDTMGASLQRMNSTSTSSTSSSVDRIIEYEAAFMQATRRKNERSTFIVVPSAHRVHWSKFNITDFPNGK